MAGGDNKDIWIIANWKSNKTIAEALEWISIVGPQIPKNNPNLKVFVCPPFTDLEEVKKAVMVGNFNLMVGSQDLSPFGEGSFTGEEAAREIAQFASLAILGHSERRKNFGETNEMVADKTKQALANNITPLVCVAGADIPVPEGCKLVAFEPLFAIGTGNPATPEDAQKVALEIKRRCGPEVEVLYGGSVNPQNVASFIRQHDISGVLVATASLDPNEFLNILKNYETD